MTIIQIYGIRAKDASCWYPVIHFISKPIIQSHYYFLSAFFSFSLSLFPFLSFAGLYDLCKGQAWTGILLKLINFYCYCIQRVRNCNNNNEINSMRLPKGRIRIELCELNQWLSSQNNFRQFISFSFSDQICVSIRNNDIDRFLPKETKTTAINSITIAQ